MSAFSNPYANISGHQPQQQPIQVYQDIFEPNNSPSMNHAPMPTANPGAAPRQIQPNGSYNFSFAAMPNSLPLSAGQSPFKAQAQAAPLAPLKNAAANARLNSIQIMPPNVQQQGTDFVPQKQPHMASYYNGPHLASAMGSENTTMGRYHVGGHGSDLTIEPYFPPNPNGKRLLESPSFKDNRPQKRVKLENQPLPPHDSFPPVMDDGSKPSHSYAMLIGMAILRSPQRRLTLAQIYKWITTNYAHYRNASDNGWQNSIRHNLSLNKNFIKHERPKDDPGKGSYWAILPGMEHTYMKEKPGRKSISGADGIAIMATTVMEPTLPPQLPKSEEPRLPPQKPSCSEPAVSEDTTTKASNSVSAAEQTDLSSDATIMPASENPIPEEPAATDPELNGESSSFSPSAATAAAAAAMNSSPPLPQHMESHGGGTPPSMRRHGSSSTLKTHRRKRASMDDSGYISSLDSSILRPQQQSLLGSDIDRSRVKRKGGRAEDEIRRLRGSSFDPSPTKGKSRNSLFIPQSSSPVRRGLNDGQMPPPLTPAYKLAPPPAAPASVSPNTTLRLHRNEMQRMIESPVKRVLGLNGENTWGTPSNDQIDESVYNFDFTPGYGSVDFDVFQDLAPHGLYPIAEDESPIKRKRSMMDSSPMKRPMKRPALSRPKSGGVLGEVTNSKQRLSLAPAPVLKSSMSPAKHCGLDTPSKAFLDLPSSPSKIFLDSPLKLVSTLGSTAGGQNDENALPGVDLAEFCSTDVFEDTTDSHDVDITKGFERIGRSIGAEPSSMPFLMPSIKPALARSRTTKF